MAFLLILFLQYLGVIWTSWTIRRVSSAVQYLFAPKLRNSQRIRALLMKELRVSTKGRTTTEKITRIFRITDEIDAMIDDPQKQEHVVVPLLQYIRIRGEPLEHLISSPADVDSEDEQKIPVKPAPYDLPTTTSLPPTPPPIELEIKKLVIDDETFIADLLAAVGMLAALAVDGEDMDDIGLAQFLILISGFCRHITEVKGFKLPNTACIFYRPAQGSSPSSIIIDFTTPSQPPFATLHRQMKRQHLQGKWTTLRSLLNLKAGVLHKTLTVDLPPVSRYDSENALWEKPLNCEAMEDEGSVGRTVDETS
ncbi:hypothetical protein C8J56DRAFT_891765 [Mycena floridula]|nr:hypothetical protein C8J56DRAFT_891765 [Mycena floridula]